MGIINVTPDSFYDRGQYITDNALLRHATQLVQEDADILDVGAMATRPNIIEILEEIEN